MSILSKKSNSGISQKITALCYTYVCFQMVGYFIRKLRREQNLKVFGICFYLLSEIAWVRSVCLVYSFTLLTSLLLQISLMFNVDVLLQEVSKPWVSSHLLTFTETFVAFLTHLLSKRSSTLKKNPKSSQNYSWWTPHEPLSLGEPPVNCQLLASANRVFLSLGVTSFTA